MPMSPRKVNSGATCAEHGTDLRGAGHQPLAATDVPGDPANAYDFGLGAGFYVDATQQPVRTALPDVELT